MHKNYTCVGVLTCINEAVKETGMTHPSSWIILDERQIKERRGCWQSLLPLPAFSAAAGESEGGSASRVSFR